MSRTEAISPQDRLLFQSHTGGLVSHSRRPEEPLPATQGPAFSVDLIEELQLRRWARRHYVPLGQRSASWHPIVLNEMLLRDRETAESTGVIPSTAPLTDLRTLRFDPPQEMGRRSELERAREESVAEYYF